MGQVPPNPSCAVTKQQGQGDGAGASPAQAPARHEAPTPLGAGGLRLHLTSVSPALPVGGGAGRGSDGGPDTRSQLVCLYKQRGRGACPRRGVPRPLALCLSRRPPLACMGSLHTISRAEAQGLERTLRTQAVPPGRTAAAESQQSSQTCSLWSDFLRSPSVPRLRKGVKTESRSHP